MVKVILVVKSESVKCRWWLQWPRRYERRQWPCSEKFRRASTTFIVSIGRIQLLMMIILYTFYHTDVIQSSREDLRLWHQPNHSLDEIAESSYDSCNSTLPRRYSRWILPQTPIMAHRARGRLGCRSGDALCGLSPTRLSQEPGANGEKGTAKNEEHGAFAKCAGDQKGHATDNE
jgi:hypothetical protein